MSVSHHNLGISHHAAILFVFPDLASLDHFKRNDPGVAAIAVPKFIAYAFEHGLLSQATENDLRNLISNADPTPNKSMPDSFSFGDLIDRLASNQSVNRLVDDDLAPLCRVLGLPDVQASMISRLRNKFVPNTRGKQNLLRALAFWIGLNRPSWGWTFSSLMQLRSAEKVAPNLDLSSGARLAFHVAARGEIHEAEALVWLRDQLSQCLKDLDLYTVSSNQVVSAATTLFVNVPRVRDNLQGVARYAKCLRDAVAIIHQVLLRWALADLSAGRHVVVALAVGTFAGLDTSLQAMLKARMIDSDLVRMTPMARTCADMSEIKVVFQPVPREVAVYEGDTLTVWVAESLWSHIYFRHIPAIEELLPHDLASLAMFRTSVLFGQTDANPLLAAAFRQPENTLLLVEIAKSCMAKGMFHEADRFVSLALASRPHHVVARTLRLILQLNIGLVQPHFPTAWMSFQAALREGAFILDRCQVESEEVYCELGQVHFCVARRLYNAILHGHIDVLREAVQEMLGEPLSPDQSIRSQGRRLVLDHLRLAQTFFDQGRTISPSGNGNRALHWSVRIQALVQLLTAAPLTFVITEWANGRIIDRHDVFREIAKRFFSSVGWTRELPAPGMCYSALELELLFVEIHQAFARYDHSVLSPSYRTTIQFAFAMLMFDFAPELNVGVLKIILKWMSEAESVAVELAEKSRGIRSIVTCCSQILPATVVAEQIRQSSQFLRIQYASLLHLPDDTPVTQGREYKFLLDGFANEHMVDSIDLI